MRDFSLDVKYAIRALKKSPGFAVIAVITLGLGMAVNTTIFSLVNGMLLRPLPVPNPGQITVLTMKQGASDPEIHFSFADYQDLQKQQGPFSDLFGYNVTLTGLTADGRGDHCIVSRVTGNYFTGLGIQPLLGRLIQPQEAEAPGSAPVIVLSYYYWQKRFGGNPNVIGRQVELDDHSATIIGVAPKDFHGTYSILEMDAFVPLTASLYDTDADAQRMWTNRGARALTLMGRLKPDVNVKEATAAMQVEADRLAAEYPDTDKGVLIRVYPERLARPDPDPNGTLPAAAAAFMGLAALVLLVACFNVANVLLVRATVRQREMAIRAALGAGRSRLVRQHLVESFILALLGGVCGLLLAVWAGGFFGSLHLAVGVPLHLDFTPDAHVYLFAFGAVLLTGILVGVIPALRVAKTNVGSVLHEGGRGSSDGPRRQFARNTLVAAQVAGSLLLLVVAGLFTRSLGNAQRVDLGFNPDHVLNLSLSPDEVGYKDPQAREFYRELLTRVRALPGVVSASEAFSVPMGAISSADQIIIADHPPAAGEQPPTVMTNFVTPGYFSTMQIALLKGRTFADADDEKAPLVAVINKTMADAYWPKEDPIGKKFLIKSDGSKEVEVVGVVQDEKYKGIAETPSPFYFRPLAQDFVSFDTLQVRTSVPPESLAAPIEAAIRELGPSVPVSNVETMSEALNGGNGFFLYRFGAQVTGAMGLLGLILAVVGVYSVVSYAAAQRTHEIGIRMALGAAQKDILALVLRQGLAIIAIGVAVGLVISFGGTRVFASMFIGVGAADPITYVSVVVLLIGVALLACWLPARRAMRVSPLTALRYE
ncbi:MAG TPA: ABC transporter permease [Candidatus Acidoferrum sp.]|nr:ABC transporter permease [Candidatus Acidoferrum sp.]